MMTFYLGAVGSCKTYSAVYDAITSPDEFVNIYTNTTINDPKKNVIRYSRVSELPTPLCGVLVIDEADMEFNSRKFEKLPDNVRNMLKEHRKDHLRIICTTQHASFVDKIFRTIADQVFLVETRSLPIIGWIFPRCVRANVHCTHCGEVRADDGRGDVYKWKKWFGFGTILIRTQYPKDILGEIEDSSPEAMDIRNITPIDRRIRLFDNRIAARYNTSEKISLEFSHL